MQQMKDLGFDSWWNRTATKNAINIILVFFCGYAGSLLANGLTCKSVSIALSAIALEFASTMYYGKRDVMINNMLQEYTNQMNVYQSALIHVAGGIRRQSLNIVSFLQRSNPLSTVDWNYNKECNTLCKYIYLIVNELARYNHQNGNIEVCYTQYDETDKSVKTIGFATSFDSYPSIYNKVRYLSDPNPYFDAKFFRNRQSQIIAEHGVDDVSICLEYPSDLEKRDHRNKYGEFVAIPILDEEKSVGLVTLRMATDSCIASNKKELLDTVTRNLSVFQQVFFSLYETNELIRQYNESVVSRSIS